MNLLLIYFVLAVAGSAWCTQSGSLEQLPADFLASLVESDSKLLASEGGSENILSKKLDGLVPEKSEGLKQPPPMGFSHGHVGKPMGLLKAPVKKLVVKKKIAKVALPKAKVLPLMKKPKVHSLKPIVHVVEKPVPVYHKVPIPKKVLVPKFYPVIKPIPVPKKVYVPYKVPIYKTIPKVVKIPKPIPVPKFIPIKKPVPIGIPYPVPKFHKVPIPKPVPYAKYIPIPVPKKVPKFIPVPVKKVIKVPKPYYVPIKVPYITTSYMKTPMVVDVPDVKKVGHPKFGGGKSKKSMMHIIPGEQMNSFKFLDSKLPTNFQDEM